MRSNRIARLKASAKARKDPFNRAARAPLVRQPSTCPIGKCEHSDLLHRRSVGPGSPPAEVAICTAPECACEEIL
jgi:hypothetical protein